MEALGPREVNRTARGARPRHWFDRILQDEDDRLTVSGPRPDSSDGDVLIVAYYYPPLNVIGARRPFSLAKWLDRLGCSVTVLTSRHVGPPGREPWKVVQAPDLLDSALNWRRGRGDLEAVSGQTSTPVKPSRWGDLFVPDIQMLSWLPFASAVALGIFLRRRPKVVVTTSPVASAHLIGLLLSRLGVPWVADLRDGWRFEPPRRDWPLASQRHFDSMLERLVVTRADAVVTVTEPLVTDIATRLGVEAQLLTNGFDPEDEPPEELVESAPTNRNLVTFVHTGGAGMDPAKTIEPLLQAIVATNAQDQVEVLVAGSMSAYESELFSRPEYSDFVTHLGFQERSDALALQRAADWLVLITSGNRRSEASGKLFEYLAAGRPILVFGEDSAAAEIAEGAGCGVTIPVRDPSAAKALLTRILADDPGLPQPGSQAPDEYLWPSLAERYDEMITDVISARGR